MRTDTVSSIPAGVQLDAWLTRKLGYTVWRVAGGLAEDARSALLAQAPLLAYAKVDTADVATLWSLSDAGFRVVITEVTFEGAVTEGPAAHARFAEPRDRDAVQSIAGSAFRHSRFHMDPLVSPDIAHAIKSEWAGNFFDGTRGDGMVVAQRDDQVVGFTQLLWDKDDCLVIDLIGVGLAHQGRGIGRSMIEYAWQRGTDGHRRPARMRVGTQTVNRSSIRLYESLGFRFVSSKYVMHFHGDAHRIH